MVKVVIFDFDGVIADSEEIHYRSFNVVLEAYGVMLDQKVYWEKYLGYTDKEAYDNINIDHNLNFSDEKIDWLIDEKSVVFDEMVRRNGIIFDGVIGFFKMLNDNDVPMAICSGAIRSDIDGIFDSTEKRIGINLAENFKTIVTADDVKEGKPDPEGYLLTLGRLQEMLDGEITADECLVVEDSHWGIEAAKAAGMKVLAVTNSYSGSELTTASDMVVESLKDLTIQQIRDKTA